MKKGFAEIIVVFLVTIVLLAGGYFAYTRYFNSNKDNISKLNTSPTPVMMDNTTYKSDLRNYTVTIPAGFNVKDKLGRVEIASSEGKIYIDGNGTNLDNLEDYLKDLHEKNNLTIQSKKNLKVNGLDTVSGTVDSQKIYYIYADNWVHIIFTEDVSLYDNLDQIAQSFRYTP